MIPSPTVSWWSYVTWASCGAATELKVLNPVAWLYPHRDHGWLWWILRERSQCFGALRNSCIFRRFVTPGNQFKSENRRRFERILCQFQKPRATRVDGWANMVSWFTLGCIPSHLVEKVQGHGLSGVMATSSILRAFLYSTPWLEAR